MSSLMLLPLRCCRIWAVSSLQAHACSSPKTMQMHMHMHMLEGADLQCFEGAQDLSCSNET